MARDGGRMRAGGTKEAEVLGGRVGSRGNLDSLCTDSRRAVPTGRCDMQQRSKVTRGNASSEIDRNNASRSIVRLARSSRGVQREMQY